VVRLSAQFLTRVTIRIKLVCAESQAKDETLVDNHVSLGWSKKIKNSGKVKVLLFKIVHLVRKYLVQNLFEKY